MINNKIEKILQSAGVEINGPNPWDPQILDKDKVILRILRDGTLGIGETYVEGLWDVEKLDELIFRVFRHADFTSFLGRGIIWQIIKNKFFNLQTIKRAFIVGQEHYDIGNDLYDAMLDKATKSYTCGYWKDFQNLDEAQIAKLDLICKKINLQKGQRVLDIGCGWGNFMKYAAENYGAICVGLTISEEQIKQGKEICKNLPVEFALEDYRTYNSREKFDHIISIGMFEHVGVKNYRNFMEVAERNLKDDGLFLLHTIGHSKTTRNVEPFINKYIFPNGHLPSPSHITKSFDRKHFWSKPLFVLEDWHNFGAYYDLTLMEWFKNFNLNFKELQKNNSKYDDRFYRIWKYYLLISAGMFRARYVELYQVVFSKKGVLGGYRSIR
jgi:cyclopropane-fatty-acyl-phospholipid synthase